MLLGLIEINSRTWDPDKTDPYSGHPVYTRFQSDTDLHRTNIIMDEILISIEAHSL